MIYVSCMTALAILVRFDSNSQGIMCMWHVLTFASLILYTLLIFRFNQNLPYVPGVCDFPDRFQH